MNSSTDDNDSTLAASPDTSVTLSSKLSNTITHSLHLYWQWWKEISLGVFIRIITLIIILYIAIINPTFPDVNDMNELITQGLVYMFQGLNPYNRDYWLSALALGPCDPYHQNFINYGPGSLLIHIPCMFYPYTFDFANCMNFQPSFLVLHCIFDFFLFDRLMRRGNRTVAVFLWANPVMVTLNFVTHMSVVLFFLWMGYEKWKDPFWSAFWLGIGAITYQYIGLLLVFAIVYHIRSYRKWFMGILPAVVIFGVFQLWASLESVIFNDPSRNMALVHDLLFVQFGRPYESWPLHIHSWWSWTGSIPAVLFNSFWIVVNQTLARLGQPMIPPSEWVGIGDPLQIVTRMMVFPDGIRISTVFTAFALFVSLYLLVKLLKKTDYKQSIKYSLIAIFLFLLGSPAGIWHHNFIVLIPAFFALIDTNVIVASK
jgi:hypothetical protein